MHYNSGLTCSHSGITGTLTDYGTAFHYPASYDMVVSVAAVDEDNHVADFSTVRHVYWKLKGARGGGGN